MTGPSIPLTRRTKGLDWDSFSDETAKAEASFHSRRETINPRIWNAWTDKSTSYNDKSTSYNDKSTSYNDKSTSYNDKSTSHNDKSTSHNDISTSHNEKSTSYYNIMP